MINAKPVSKKVGELTNASPVNLFKIENLQEEVPVQEGPLISTVLAKNIFHF